MKKMIRLIALLAVLLPLHAWSQTVTIGCNVTYSPSGTTTTSTTTACGSSTTTGSTFVVFVDEVSSDSALLTVTDNKSNTYTQGPTYNYAGVGPLLTMWYCINCTGGSGHTATATWTTSAYNWISFVEFKGVGAGTIHSTPAGQGNSGSVSTMTAPTITTAVAKELVINAYGQHAGGTRTITDSGAPWSIATSQPTGSLGPNGAVSWQQPASSSSAVADTFTWTGGADSAVGIAMSIEGVAPVVTNGVHISNGHPVKSGTSILYQ